MGEQDVLARVKFPSEWVEGQEWVHMEVIATGKVPGGLAVLGGGVLVGGVNLAFVTWPGGQWFARMPLGGPLTEHFTGEEPPKSVREMWRVMVHQMVESARWERAASVAEKAAVWETLGPMVPPKPKEHPGG